MPDIYTSPQGIVAASFTAASLDPRPVLNADASIDGTITASFLAACLSLRPVLSADSSHHGNISAWPLWVVTLHKTP